MTTCGSQLQEVGVVVFLFLFYVDVLLCWDASYSNYQIAGNFIYDACAV